MMPDQIHRLSLFSNSPRTKLEGVAKGVDGGSSGGASAGEIWSCCALRMGGGSVHGQSPHRLG
jgi:hypothetical protein